MSFSFAEEMYAKAEAAFEKELLNEIERLAKMVITTIPKAKSFCMAMGSASFHCEWREFEPGDETDFWECDEHLDASELSDDNSYAQDLDNLLGKYGRKFCLTGCPMMIRRDPETGELVRSEDW